MTSIGSATSDEDRVFDLLGKAKRLAQEYRRLTGKPLGITGEVAEYEAARLLELSSHPAPQPGTTPLSAGTAKPRQLQMKGRCLLDDAKPGQRLGSIRAHHEWDAVLMMLLDENLDAVAIYEAERDAIVAALTVPGSRARNERGALGVEKFKRIGTRRWPSAARARELPRPLRSPPRPP